MRGAWQKLAARPRRLALAEEGAAIVEFALILPIMLFVYIGSVEASIAISMDRRVQSVAGALGDLVARSDKTIPSATLADYFKAAGGIMTPYPATGLRQMVTQVRVPANGTPSIVEWSWQYVDGDLSVGDHAEGSTFTLPNAMINVAHDPAKDTFVIVSEGSYTYTPLSGFVFNQPINFYRENFLMPRFGDRIAGP